MFKRKFHITVILRPTVGDYVGGEGVEEEFKVRILATSEHAARRRVLSRAYKTDYLVSYFQSVEEVPQ